MSGRENALNPSIRPVHSLCF